jgi:hypothetical protein
VSSLLSVESAFSDNKSAQRRHCTASDGMLLVSRTTTSEEVKMQVVLDWEVM